MADGSYHSGEFAEEQIPAAQRELDDGQFGQREHGADQPVRSVLPRCRPHQLIRLGKRQQQLSVARRQQHALAREEVVLTESRRAVLGEPGVEHAVDIDEQDRPRIDAGEAHRTAALFFFSAGTLAAASVRRTRRPSKATAHTASASRAASAVAPASRRSGRYHSTRELTRPNRSRAVIAGSTSGRMSPSRSASFTRSATI